MDFDRYSNKGSNLNKGGNVGYTQHIMGEQNTLGQEILPKIPIWPVRELGFDLVFLPLSHRRWGQRPGHSRKGRLIWRGLE